MRFPTWMPVSALALALVTGPARASEVTAELDRASARVGEEVVLTVVCTGTVRSVPEVQLTGLQGDFDVYAAGQSQSVSFINGKMSAQTSRRFVLLPKREGTFTVGPLEVRVGNETLRTPPLSLTVTAGAPPPAAPPGSQEGIGESTGSEDLFVRATVDKAEAFLYEQVTLRVRLYTRQNLLDNPGYSPPATEGFWREDLPPPDPQVETVNGKRYRVLEVRMALFPTRPGTLTVGEAVLDCTVESAVRRTDPFSGLGGLFRDGKRVVLRSQPVSVRVRPLPPGAPAGFGGAVGEYRLDVTADRRELNQTEPLTLTLRVSGEGHLRTVGELALPELPGFRSYSSAATQDQKPEGSRIRGSMTQQFVLVPLSAGELTVPPVEFVYFSPKERMYKTERSQPLVVRAAAGAPGTGGGGRGAIEVVGRDIRFIETEVPKFGDTRGPWAAARPWLTLLPVPFLGYGVLWGWEERRRRSGADRVARRRANAARRAAGRLKAARRLGPAEAAPAAGEALRGYLADRFDLAEAGLTPDQVEERLTEAGLDPGPCLALLERIDAARFAPHAAGAAGADWVHAATEILAGLERRKA